MYFPYCSCLQQSFYFLLYCFRMHWSRSSCLLLYWFGVRIYVQSMLNVVGIYSWHFVGIPSENIHVACEEVYKFGSVGRTQFPTDLKILLWIRRENYCL
jgi:hypothetical protein